MAEKNKGYVIGISSGMFMAAAEGEKETYLTVPRKIFYGGVKGVNFTQLDIESITEFNEPNVEEGVKKVKELGIRFGVHGESYAMGGAERPISMLDVAIETEYFHAHQRLIQHIEGSGKLGAEYLLIHSSESTPFIRLGMHLQPSKLVDPWGRPLKKFIEEDKKTSEKLKEWILNTKYLWEFMHYPPEHHISTYMEKKLYEIISMGDKEKREPTKEELKKIEDDAKKYALEIFFENIDTPNNVYGPEKTAYYIIAKWMMMEKHQLWMNIVGKMLNNDDLYNFANNLEKSWVPAVSAMYILGHFTPKDTNAYPDPKPLLKKFNLLFVFETPMAGHGTEGLMRLARPRDMCFLAKAINSDFVGVAYDSEHMLGSNINPLDEAKSLPAKAGELIKVIHLGYPTPHSPAHMPIPVGSEAQLFLYKVLFELRKKGFNDGYLIFERAGEQSIQQSVIAIRLMVQFLEKDVLPDKLPEEFYGMKPGGPEIARQLVMIREHALDPMRGLITVPEEEHGFFGKAAIEKGKGEEWKKEKYK